MVGRFTLLYTALFVAYSLVNRYDVWLTLPPASIHQWRQADGAAIAWNYAQNPDFFQPRINNLFAGGDEHAVGEWPGLYWLAGKITKITGAPDYPLRWIGWLMLFAGGWAFGWMVLQWTRKPMMAALGAIILLSAPVLSYYSPSSLPDAPAFCGVLVMMACLMRAHQRQSLLWLGASTVAAMLAISLKISSAILPLALIATWWQGKLRRQWETFPLWNGYLPITAQIVLISAILLLRIWIHQYNIQHGTGYFLSSTRPIWLYDVHFILETMRMTARYVAPYFLSIGFFGGIMAGVWAYIRAWDKLPFFWKYVPVWSLAGSTAYFLLWFRMFREHDYYSLCLLILPTLMWLFALIKWPEWWNGALGRSAIWWLCGLGLIHSHVVMSGRLRTTGPNYLPVTAFLDEQTYQRLGLPNNARWLCPDDPSPNSHLLALRGYGWTAYNFGHQIPADTIRFYQQKYQLSHLALRDSTRYDSVYRVFFPKPIKGVRGWYFYGR
jgi:hypothetical protein